MRRVNIPRDASSWCTDGDTVFTAVLDQLLCIDAATGKIKKTLYLPSSSTKKKGEWAYLGSENDRIYGSSVRKDTFYKDFWGKYKWYDKIKAESMASFPLALSKPEINSFAGSTVWYRFTTPTLVSC